MKQNNIIVPKWKLQNGVEIPSLGYGTYFGTLREEGRITAYIEKAMKIGYRHFDTASHYGTEKNIAEAIEHLQMNRKNLFLTSKMWKNQMGYEKTKKAFEETLESLKTTYLDLYLIHWPVPTTDYKNWSTLDLETWRAMEELYEKKKIRAIGVCNFQICHLENLLQNAKIMPMVNQLEIHPGCLQKEIVDYCKNNNIQVSAWSPFGRKQVLQEPVIKKMAQKYRTSPAQICIQFARQNGIIPLPKASSEMRMIDNIKISQFRLSEEDIKEIEGMPESRIPQ